MNAQPIRVYWQPGCSSCVRVKEFLRKQDVPYESVNVLEHENAFEELEKLGARGFPVVTRGSEFVFGQSIEDVAKFLNKDIKFELLPPGILMDRMFYFIDAAIALVEHIPMEHLWFNPIPNRDRSFLGLAYHCIQVPDSFYQTVAQGETDLMKYFDSPPPPNVTTPTDVALYGQDVSKKLHQWWDSTADHSLQWTVETFYGVQPLPKFLERSTWHAAQHVRQLMAVLDDFKVHLPQRIEVAAYQGLPMPDALWQ